MNKSWKINDKRKINTLDSREKKRRSNARWIDEIKGGRNWILKKPWTGFKRNKLFENRVHSSKIRILGSKIRILVSKIGILGSEIQILGSMIRIHSSEIRIHGSEIRILRSKI